MEWWDELLRACAADGPTSECPPNTVVMTEVELDARKVHANHLHLHLTQWIIHRSNLEEYSLGRSIIQDKKFVCRSM